MYYNYDYGHYYPYYHRRYYPYYDIYRPYYPYYNSDYGYIEQDIYNSGYMNDVWQNAYIYNSSNKQRIKAARQLKRGK